MTLQDVHKDLETRTLTITAEFDASAERVWQLWADPRLLERWWGPPEYPATFVAHDLVPGGHVSYYMTGPEGDQPRGWWRVRAVDPPHRLEFEDGFADEHGKPVEGMPVSKVMVTIEAQAEGRTRHDHRVDVRVDGGHGTDPRHGRRGRPDRRAQPDRRAARRTGWSAVAVRGYPGAGRWPPAAAASSITARGARVSKSTGRRSG